MSSRRSEIVDGSLPRLGLRRQRGASARRDRLAPSADPQRDAHRRRPRWSAQVRRICRALHFARRDRSLPRAATAGRMEARDERNVATMSAAIVDRMRACAGSSRRGVRWRPESTSVSHASLACSSSTMPRAPRYFVALRPTSTAGCRGLFAYLQDDATKKRPTFGCLPG